MKNLIPAAILLALLGCGAKSDLPPADKTALFRAVERGDIEQLRRALAAGVSPNLYQSERGYLIQQAVAVGNKQALNILIDAGADVNASKDPGYAPLLVAAVATDCEASRMLLSAGADPDRRLEGSYKAALDPAFEGKTALEIHRLQIQKVPGLSGRDKACWSDVERLLTSRGS